MAGHVEEACEGLELVELRGGREAGQVLGRLSSQGRRQRRKRA